MFLFYLLLQSLRINRAKVRIFSIHHVYFVLFTKKKRHQKMPFLFYIARNNYLLAVRSINERSIACCIRLVDETTTGLELLELASPLSVTVCRAVVP